VTVSTVPDPFNVVALKDAPIQLRTEHISKSFGAVTALRDVSIHLRKGEVLALVGDNGAGKSTFIKILCGFHPPDGGTIEWEGKPLHLKSPLDARQHGIETVYQDLALVNDLSVAQNMFLGREKLIHLGGFEVPLTDNTAMKRQTRAHLNRLGINLPSVSSLVRQLSGGQRQSIAVARSMQTAPKLLIMDEPLAALGVREGGLVLELIQNLRRHRETSIILIVHNYNQVFEVCDRINFLHSGEIVLDRSTADTTEEELIRIVKSGLGRSAVAESVAASAGI
jgi:simple sugar transport system ATP-binding protein